MTVIASRELSLGQSQRVDAPARTSACNCGPSPNGSSFARPSVSMNTDHDSSLSGGTRPGRVAPPAVAELVGSRSASGSARSQPSSAQPGPRCPLRISPCLITRPQRLYELPSLPGSWGAAASSRSPSSRVRRSMASAAAMARALESIAYGASGEAMQRKRSTMPRSFEGRSYTQPVPPWGSPQPAQTIPGSLPMRGHPFTTSRSAPHLWHISNPVPGLP